MLAELIFHDHCDQKSTPFQAGPMSKFRSFQGLIFLSSFFRTRQDSWEPCLTASHTVARNDLGKVGRSLRQGGQRPLQFLPRDAMHSADYAVVRPVFCRNASTYHQTFFSLTYSLVFAQPNVMAIFPRQPR